MASAPFGDIPLDELRAALGPVLSRHFGSPRSIRELRRRRSAYASSCPITNLSVRLDRGQELQLVFKDLSPAAELPTAREVRPHFLFDPRREIEVYRAILAPRRWGTPVFYGAVESPGLGRFWLFLERVSGPVLWQIGRLETWTNAARWLATMHRELAPLASNPKAQATSHLSRYDRHFFELWRDRAVEAVRRRKFLDRSTRRRFRRLVDAYDRVIAQLAALPPTVIHGEFYPSNVVIRRNGQRGAVCPLDWELCGIGPGVLDLAALSAGRWPDDARQQMIDAYRDAWGTARGERPSNFELIESVRCGQLHLAIQMLGWAVDWTPPAGHTQDWLQQALRLAQALGL